MDWTKTQLKYELLRISEILVSWAKFAKSEHLADLNEYHTQILTEALGYQQLKEIKITYWQIIANSQNARLINDLKDYFKEEQEVADMHEFGSATS